MANTTFSGPVRSKNGFINTGPGAVKALTLATDLTVADHAGRFVTMDPAGTPTAITIPAIISTADAASAGPGSDPNNKTQLEQLLKFFSLIISQELSKLLTLLTNLLVLLQLVSLRQQLVNNSKFQQAIMKLILMVKLEHLTLQQVV